MIFYNEKNYKKQIKTDYKQLEDYKNSYNKRISLYNIYLDTIPAFEDGIIENNKLNKEELEKKIKSFQIQINKIDSCLDLLNNFLKKVDITGKIKINNNVLIKYNQEYSEISNDYINNSVGGEQITMNYINGLMADVAQTLEKTKEKNETEKNAINVMQEQQTENCVKENVNKNSQLKNNDTLLISEKINKVILPYRAEEVLEIFNSEDSEYASLDEVIEDKFTRNFSDFKIQFFSRYNETMKLARERENYNIADAVLLATEMMKKKYLHPAIIAACKNLNELDVYLDCLDKNELEEFRIFKIKYEIYPMMVKQNKLPRGRRYDEDSKLRIWGF